MLKSFNGLTQQLFEKPFREMLYGVYNFAEDEFYIHRMKNLGYDTDIDSLEFMSIDRGNSTDNDLLLFKKYVEEDLEKGKTLMEILFLKGKKGIVPIAIKPKSVGIEDILKEE